MATPWCLINPTWLCSVEILAIELRMMFGFSISTKAHSNGKNMNFKARFVHLPEFIIVLQFVKKVLLKA